MGFDYGDLKNENPNDETGERISRSIKEGFSKYCDAVLHGFTCEMFGLDTTVTDECRCLEKKGHYVPKFYMVEPYYYLGVNTRSLHLVRNGVLFLKISESENPENLYISDSMGIGSEVLSDIPVVLFRLTRQYIGCYGPCDVKDDLIHTLRKEGEKRLLERLPLYEFIGVFKAELKESDRRGNIYKMTKVFDRYYFDDTKIQSEVSSAAPF